MFKILLISCGLVLLCVMFHGFVLQSTARTLFYEKGRFSFYRVGLLILVAILAHLVEIVFFQVAYHWLEPDLSMGTIVGSGLVDHVPSENEGNELSASDVFYFSAVTYTSTGYGDLTPTGNLRLLAMVEALTGLIMVAWTTSYAFVVMVNYWERQNFSKSKSD